MLVTCVRNSWPISHGTLISASRFQHVLVISFFDRQSGFETVMYSFMVKCYQSPWVQSRANTLSISVSTKVMSHTHYIRLYPRRLESSLLFSMVLIFPLSFFFGFKIGRKRQFGGRCGHRAVGSRGRHKPSLRPVTAHGSGFKSQKPEAAAQADGFL